MRDYITRQRVVEIELKRAAMIQGLNMMVRIILMFPDIEKLFPHLLSEIEAHLTILEYPDGESSHE